MPDHDELARALTDFVRHHALELEGALLAHGDWKRQLQDAIARGFFELSADDAGRDDLCPLGRWLKVLESESCAEPWYPEVVEVHARFHREAATVVQYIEAGRIDEARTAMDPGSDFARASEELVGLLEEWRDAA